MANTIPSEQYEKMPYKKYLGKAQLDKAIMTLEGIIQGISLDGKITTEEVEELSFWCNLNKQYIEKSFFKDVIPAIDAALDDNVLTKEEIEDILWLCDSFTHQEQYFNALTINTQKLHGILHGILADNIISDDEILALSDWLNDNTALEKTYPYDEISSLLLSILKDGMIDEHERNVLKLFFSEFVDLTQSSNLNSLEIEQLHKDITIKGICMSNPEIVFPDKLFCFTGVSAKAKRSVIAQIIESKGGKHHDNIIDNTDYLVVGNEGNPCWAFSCYGRKVEKAVTMRKSGKEICIINEIDFWDAI